ncbi:(4Fe-4S)-binding protein [Flammeovirga kamogawensis]|uniref:(4Fe-4S)-binding protein n=1 Tax=Flammeovirga kamogawensis TaxID=373891 RepID=A0ABX8H1Q8_9BACT|nr:(4Fe-4S)-binding protein [Flammeovirga kamogawensis]MBB6459529.1 putative Fe-S cluster protein YjdI [Flammeovirga kamogawensis]QWG09080.1 (4Fe-4S)-binding protein [Flammeovirga kamogawensis]TRX67368.1 hypothetical protein EO216_04120 [Flammeovirga kamogawensis]
MSSKEIIKTYSNNDIEIVWQPNKCIHSTKCFQALPSVFDPTKRPWVSINAAPTADIILTVKNCPSGALSLKTEDKDDAPEIENDIQVTVLKDGPILIKGSITLTAKGNSESLGNKQIALCRCGHSANKPYCDGQHAKNGFKAD